MENGGIKGVNFFKKQSLKDKKDANCLMVKNTIAVALTECFPAKSSLDNGVSDIAITREVS